MTDSKNWNILYKKAKEELANDALFKAAELFEEAAENALSSKEKIKALSQALYIYIRPKGLSTFSPAARVGSKISELLKTASPHKAMLYEKIKEYYNRLQEHLDNEEANTSYEQPLLKIKDCFLQMDNYIATALVLKHLGEIAFDNKYISEKWEKKVFLYFRESAFLFEKAEMWEDAGETYKSAGYVAQEQGKYGIMEDCFLKSAECFMKGHDIQKAARCYSLLYCEDGLKDLSKRLKYAMLSIEYSIAVSDFLYLEETIKSTEELIGEESDPEMRKDYLLALTELAIKGKEYSLGAILYEKMCNNDAYKLSAAEKTEIKNTIPGLLEKQRAKYKEDAEVFLQSGDFLSAAETYIKLAGLTKAPVIKWMYQLEAALNYGSYRAPIYAERSDEIYDQMGDINTHYDSLEKNFILAIKYAPGEKEKKITIEKAKHICDELAQFYGDETDRMYCMGDSLGQGFWKQFKELGQRLAGRQDST